jgi:hypothetical protein
MGELDMLRSSKFFCPSAWISDQGEGPQSQEQVAFRESVIVAGAKILE